MGALTGMFGFLPGHPVRFRAPSFVWGARNMEHGATSSPPCE